MTYRSIDFRPIAVAGWRALYVFEDGEHYALALVGWLIQEEEPTEVVPGDRNRRIVAAIAAPDEYGIPADVNEHGDSWDDWRAFDRLLAPDEPVPDAEAIAAIHARKAESKARTIAHRAKLAAEDAPKVLGILERSTIPMSSEAVASRLGHRRDDRAYEALRLLESQGQASQDDRWAWTATGPEAQA